MAVPALRGASGPLAGALAEAAAGAAAHGARQLASGGAEGFTFGELYAALLFLLATWMAGKLAAAARMPGLVGEIAVGILLGPNLFEFVPKVGSFKLIGEIGLMLLVVEAGLDVDLEMLRLVGARGALVAVLGSLTPLAIGFIIGHFVIDLDTRGAFVVGAAVAPTSMGIALNVLRSGKVLNTPIGQLVIAAAVLDDIIALVLLSELEALEHPSAWAFARPVVVALALLIGFGWFAIKVMPRFMNKIVFPHVPEAHHYNLTLGFIFLLTLALAPLARAAGSSYLLGCFIAGLCFATETKVHHVWVSQVKRILSWLLRIFFACTIGFEIPVRAFASLVVWRDAALVMLCIIGKLGTGLLAKPLNSHNMLTVAFAMSAWGEFAFIVVLYGKANGIISSEIFAAVVLAILMSVILSPILLRATLDHFARKARRRVQLAKDDTGDDAKGSPPLYYFVQSQSKGGWGQQDRLLRTIVELDLSIIDMRSYHAPHNNLDTNVVYEVYLKDNKMRLPVQQYREPTPEQDELIHERLRAVHEAMLGALNDPTAVARVGRWFAGIHNDDASEILLDDAEALDQSVYHLARAQLNNRRASDTSLTITRMVDPEGANLFHELDGFVHDDFFNINLAFQPAPEASHHRRNSRLSQVSRVSRLSRRKSSVVGLPQIIDLEDPDKRLARSKTKQSAYDEPSEHGDQAHLKPVAEEDTSQRPKSGRMQRTKTAATNASSRSKSGLLQRTNTEASDVHNLPRVDTVRSLSSLRAPPSPLFSRAHRLPAPSAAHRRMSTTSRKVGVLEIYESNVAEDVLTSDMDGNVLWGTSDEENEYDTDSSLSNEDTPDPLFEAADQPPRSSRPASQRRSGRSHASRTSRKSGDNTPSMEDQL